MVRRFFLSAVFLAATLLPASAQHRATVISQHYTTAEGLPSNNVMCALKDRDGFLWFGTWYGLCRFDGDNGEYSLLLGNAKGVDGPKGMGTYLWVEVDNIKRLEAKIVEGPYIHHCVGIHKDVVPVLYEACKYMGITPDLYDPIEEEVKAYLRGE